MAGSVPSVVSGSAAAATGSVVAAVGSAAAGSLVTAFGSGVVSAAAAVVSVAGWASWGASPAGFFGRATVRPPSCRAP
ncbi:MAG: hypothetical protein ACJ77B_06080 [Chloroflexota bacterium]